jgi:Phosphoglycerol transferase and related proteins, alkaline phosphatase superfamily
MPVAEKADIRREDHAIASHLDTERCALRALSRWVESLKEAGVYDNTQIILVSDHDGNDNALVDDYYTAIRKRRIPWKPHALLMVKGIGERGPLRIDDSLMSSTDALSLICRDNGPCPDLPGLNKDVLNGAGSKDGKELTERTRIHDAGLASIRRHKEDRFNVTSYRVTGSMFQRENWAEAPELNR